MTSTLSAPHEAPAPGGRRDRASRRRRVPWGLVVAVAAAAFVAEHLHPELLLQDTTPTGGDTAAHVWAPDALWRDFLSDGRLGGWSADWFAGFPAFRFYMVLPSLLIAVLGTVIPANIAFKLVAAAGPITLPLAAYAAARLGRLPTPAPALAAVATLPFLFDTTHTIWGGNIAASLAGEFAYSLALSTAVLTVGLVAKGLRTGQGGAAAAVGVGVTVLLHPIPALLAVVGGAALVLTAASIRSRVRWAFAVGAVGVGLSAWWVLPFWWDRALVVDLGWEPLSEEWSVLTRLEPGADNLRLVMGAAVVGALVAWTQRIWFLRALAVTAATLATIVMVLPAGQLWNARVVPLWYVAVHLLAAGGVAMALRAVADHRALLRPWGQGSAAHLAVTGAVGLCGAAGLVSATATGTMLARVALVLLVVEALIVGTGIELTRWVPSAGAAVAALVVLVGVALPLRSLPGGTAGADGSYRWGPLSTTEQSFVPAWAAWNNEGYEAKTATEAGGGWAEYEAIVATMADLGQERGCGRAMWEAGLDLERYGSPMALGLLPYWTDGCVASMEGLFFESSGSTPFHFVNQSELSADPLPAQSGVPYPGFDVDRGVDHLELWGVRYYLARSPLAVDAAVAHPGLSERARSGPWVIFEVDRWSLVEPLSIEPVVVEGLEPGTEWQTAALMPYLGVTDPSVLVAADGPDDWTRVGADALDVGVGAISIPTTPVADVVVGDDRVSFSVAETGRPILVKVSWFPSWRARGADGPYRISPNLMVVVPTATEVELYVATRTVDRVAWGLTLASAMGAVVLTRLRWRRPPPVAPPRCLVATSNRGSVGGDGLGARACEPSRSQQ